MNSRRLLRFFAILLLGAYFGSSLMKAFGKIDSFPVHRGYSERSEGFIHFSVGSLDQIDRDLLDENDVLLYDYGDTLGRQYNPLFIADFVLSLVPFAGSPDAQLLMSANLGYLRRSAVLTAQNNLLFPYNFDFDNAGESAPWYSAMAQARVAQAMMWGYRLTGEAEYLQIARSALLGIREGLPSHVLARQLTQGIWLKEFPRYRYHVLDGSLVAIVGVHEVLIGLPEGDPGAAQIRNLFSTAMTGFKENYHCFTSPVGGVFFADNFRFANQSYYDIIMTHLAYLAELDPELLAIFDQYSLEGMSTLRKLIVYYWNRVARTLNRWGLLDPCVR
ncbi:MAG: D-glucuronyl C5-epimerase family protein [Pseudomonadales bacterium]